MDSAAFEHILASYAADIGAQLAVLLGDVAQLGEQARPARLMAAMRHGSLNGGKRLRPFLIVHVAKLFDGAVDVSRAALGLECVHCYSLIHDDLPAMDNDDLRRGQPTVHRAFDEATAILAGDGLLTLAFELTALSHPSLGAGLVVKLARASGLGGMVGGQMLDLAAEGRFGGVSALDEAAIRQLQSMKTGALIRYACEAGARLGGASAQDVARLTRYGEVIGLAFQLADDLLDVEGDASVIGKATAKDAGMGKGTLVSLYGVAETRRVLHALVDEAEALLAPFGARAEVLITAARFIAVRSK